MVYLLPLFTVIIWGGNTIANKMAASVIEPSAMSFYRWFVAVLIFTPFCLHSAWKQRTAIKAHLPKIAVLASLGMVINQSLGYYAGLTTTASNMALISSLVPLFSVFLSIPLLGKRLSFISIFGAIFSLIGLAFMLGKGDPTFFLHRSIVTGDGLMILAAISYATYCVLLKRWKMPFSTTISVYCQGCCSLIMLAPLWLSSNQLLPTTASLPLIAYAAVLASVIAPILWIKAIEKIGADSSAMFMNLMPVVAITLAAILLGEELHAYHFIGGFMVISGVIISQLKLNNLRFKGQNRLQKI